MKKTGKYWIFGGVLILASAFIYISIGQGKKNTPDNEKNVREENSSVAETKTVVADKLQVFLFHSTSRCHSCVTMGEYLKDTIEKNFQNEVKGGKIEFREINVDLLANKEVASKFKAAGTALFINAIIDGQDNIQEEAQAWRLLGNQKTFSNYLTKKLRGMIGETVSAGTQKEMEKMNITYYSGDNCPDCANIGKYLADNGVKDKVSFEEKNVSKNPADSEQMAEDALQCNVDPESFGVPLLWADGKCYLEEKSIIDFFNEKINGIS